MTTLITLYAKALDSRSKHPILGDRKADEIASMIDYDFERFGSVTIANAMVVRSRQMDIWVREFLSANREPLVLNLGCGLDARISRIEPPPGVSWFDLDYPEVIRERRYFFSEHPGYCMLGSSVSDPGWFRDVPHDRPTMVVAEGLFEYLTAGDVRILLDRLTEQFPGGQVAFDVMNSFAVGTVNRELKRKVGVELRWAVDDLREVDKLNPSLKRVSNVDLLASRYIPLGYRVALASVQVVPRFRNMVRLLRYEF